MRETPGRVLDRRSGVETSGRLPTQQLGWTDPEQVGYEPTEWNVITRTLNAVDVGAGDALLDVGSGKGRVLIAAAMLPFRRVVGIELSPLLANIARENVAAIAHRARAGSVEVIEADARTFDIPPDVTHVYLYNPFRGAIFREFLDRLVASLDAHRRPLTLIYAVPTEHEQVMATGRFELERRVRRSRIPLRRGQSGSVYIYAARPSSEPA